MKPVLFEMGPVAIYSYGVFSALALCLAAALGWRRSKKFGIDPGRSVDVVFILFVAGIAGARLFFIFQHLDLYRALGWRALDLREGGLVWYGGFLTAFAASFVCIHRLRVSAWIFGDWIAPVLAAAHAVGRIGCFMNGCCYGVGRLPVQLVESAFLAVLAWALWRRDPAKGVRGDIFLLYVLGYAAGRFGIEFWRADQEHYIGLSLPQMISLVLWGAAATAWIYRHGRKNV